MSDAAVKTYQDLSKAKREIAAKCYPAFDELLLYSLERRHLDVPEYKDIIMAAPEDGTDLRASLNQDVRLLKIDEFSFDSKEELHLVGVESVLSSMRGAGHSLLFIVQGNEARTSVYFGLSKFVADAADCSSCLESYKAAWEAHFPGSKLENISTDETTAVSYDLVSCSDFGVLTGIPSLKRGEDTRLFVQGLERLIRAMRGKIYTWISIADPIPQDEIRNAIDACQQLQSDIHHLVKTDLSKATSNGKTVMFGLFGMAGEGKSEGSSVSESETASEGTATTKSTSETTSESDAHTTSNTVGGSVFASGGASVGFFGTGGHVEAGASVDYHRTWGDIHTVGKSIGSSIARGVMSSLAKGWVNTVTQAVSTQLGGGGFSSFGWTWTKTTTVGQELLNRKAEYAEEVLQAYEKRLHEGTALGMWNLGHYFCAADSNTYSRGIGIVTSLFSGMDGTYEPPRAIKMPTAFRETLRRFQNVYLRFPERAVSREDLRRGNVPFKDHPLGFFFNGPATPVNTRELAIATPLATQDVDGVSVSRRPGFGVNLPSFRRNRAEKTLTLGQILDKGNSTRQTYRLSYSNLPKHLSVFGLTGSGKTNTVHQLLIQLWKNEHIPFMVIEPAKAEYRALSTMDEFKDDLLVLSAGIDQTDACPLRLNPFDFDPGSDSDVNRVHVLTHIDRLKATFNASFPMYASMPYILEEAILEVYRDRGWDLGRSKNRFANVYGENFRDYVPTLQDLYWKVKEVVKRKGYYQEQTMNIQAALQARLSSLMVGAKGSMFNCVRSIPSKDLFDRPVIVELENLGDDDEKAFLMGLLVSRLYEYRKATFSASGAGAGGVRHVLVIEEAHRLLANVPDTSADMESGNPKGKAVSSFVDMLSEIRAMGQSVLVVDQLPSRVSPNIVKGTGTKIVHRLLAKDDRESVGWTMGMSDEQIADLCLFRTGECAVSQDGDRTSYFCRVNKCEAHESRVGGEISEATTAYKREYAELFVLPAGDIDMEDARFKDDLYKAMLAIGIGQSPETVIAALHPSRLRGEWTNRNEWFDIYWQQVCAEMWSFHGGSYGDFLSMRKTGQAILAGNLSALGSYLRAFSDFMNQSRHVFDMVDGTVVGIAYQPFLIGLKIFEKINQRYDEIKAEVSAGERLAAAIRKVLPVLEPTGVQLAENARRVVISEIVTRISPGIVDQILNLIDKGESHAT